MAAHGNTADGLISVPKGGGALKGIGETFSPDLFTGTGNFSIPIDLPSGRNGYEPEISLVYSTGNGNGPFGLGWSLSIPGVSRKTAKGVPRYDDNSDIFILSGAEDLVVAERAATWTRYRPRTEGLFARIYHHRGAQENYWQVKTKDGLVSHYGTPSTPDDPAVIRDPENKRHIYAWKLTETRDPFGNKINYEYKRDEISDTGYADQLYLRRIRYVDFTESHDGQEADRFLVSVDFIYEDRPDSFSEFRPGFELQTRKRCRRIEIHTHAGMDQLVKRYEFVYLDERDDLTAHRAGLPINGVSLLSQVKVIGQDGDKTEQLPPVEFGYSEFKPDRRNLLPLTGEFPIRSLADPNLELTDLFGNGLPDFVEINGVTRYWRNQGGGRFDPPRIMKNAPAGVALGDPGVQLLDANGNGRGDLRVSNGGSSGVYPLNFQGEWDQSSYRPERQAPSFSLKSPNVRLMDLDGDGVTDAIRSGSRLECYFNRPDQGWGEPRFVERSVLKELANVDFTDARVKSADMSGDGLQDLVFIYDGSILYLPSRGHGNWAPIRRMRSSPRFPQGYDINRVLFGDIDGDGLADLVYVDHNRVLVWINQSGGAWSDPIEISGTPPVTNQTALRLVDLLGTGIAGLLWSNEAGLAGARSANYFLDFAGGIKPYLLERMNNHMGAVTRVEYQPSTAYYLSDQEDRRRQWSTTLPFPVQVVSRVEVFDQFSRGKLSTEYRYVHGYWDGAEREFRGFGLVVSRDTESFTRYHDRDLSQSADFAAVSEAYFSPPTETRTWFHLGPVGEEFGDWKELDFSAAYWRDESESQPSLLSPARLQGFLKRLPRRLRRDAVRTLRGSILRTELYALDGSSRESRPYTVTEQSYSLCAVLDDGKDARLACDAEGLPEAWSSHPARAAVFFPHDEAQRTTQWERGSDPRTQFSFTEQFDDYGQPTQTISVACPRGWRNEESPLGEPYLATRTDTLYARSPLDSETYIVDRVARVDAYEIVSTVEQTLADVRILAKGGNRDSLVRIGQSLNFYDGEAFSGLPLQEVGRYGAVTCTRTLILTTEILRAAYANAGGSELPPYLVADGPAQGSGEYPEAFRDKVPELAGYEYQDGNSEEYAEGYFATAGNQYDFHGDALGKSRGLLTTICDPMGQKTDIEYDAYSLFPTRVTDPIGLTASADYDYRALQVARVTDNNSNQSIYRYSPLGLPLAVAVMGRPGENLGDTSEEPGVRYEYNLQPVSASGLPIAVRTIRRVHHVNDELSPQNQHSQNETITTVEYSDGLGRLLQARTQAEDVVYGTTPFGDAGLSPDQASPRQDAIGRDSCPSGDQHVVVSGWKIYSNKGLEVETYEPYFDCGWDFKLPGSDQQGQKARLFYDPRGQVIRTLNPDGSEQRVIYGVPGSRAAPDISNPNHFEPTPWEVYTYDENDNAGRTHPGDAGSYEQHWNTPNSIIQDSLGRTIRATERNGRDPDDGYSTESFYDIRGNVIRIKDQKSRDAFEYVYDLTPRDEDDEEDEGPQVWRIWNFDAGTRRVVFDVLGNEIERRDSKGALILQTYDELGRPIDVWARDNETEDITLREHLIYGDSIEAGLSEIERDVGNLRGALYRQYDEAGALLYPSYNFKGNLLGKTRRVIDDRHLLQTFDRPPEDWTIKPFRVDWTPVGDTSLDDHAETLLAGAQYTTAMTYDGLNRIVRLQYPQDVTGRNQELVPLYNRAGALQQVWVNDEPYVQNIAYNAKGQRTLIAYGNGVMTRYAYDESTFRLLRLCTENYSEPMATTYHPRSDPLQDLAYDYDLSGNILEIHDRVPGCGIPDTQPGLDRLDRFFTYDPIYRLKSATGRECQGSRPVTPWQDDIPKCQNSHLTRPYEESYEYDTVGNIEKIVHETRVRTANGHQSETHSRRFSMVDDSNRLQEMEVGTTAYAYHYDVNGNMTRENGARHFEWDHSDQLRVFRTQPDNAEPSLHAQYLYDSEGQRVVKLIRKQGGDYEVRIYIDGGFEHYRWSQKSNSAAQNQNNILHVMDDQQRIALLRVGLGHPKDAGPDIQYHLGDHLGSSNLVIDENGNMINREEHTPYGETSFGGFSRKRYRFTGKERDEEGGLNYHGARYYASWLGRWISVDSIAMKEETNGYIYSKSNPLIYYDKTGNKENREEKTDGSLSDNIKVECLSSSSRMGAGGTSDEIWQPKNAKSVSRRWYIRTSFTETPLIDNGDMRRRAIRAAENNWGDVPQALRPDMLTNERANLVRGLGAVGTVVGGVTLLHRVKKSALLIYSRGKKRSFLIRNVAKFISTQFGSTVLIGAVTGATTLSSIITPSKIGYGDQPHHYYTPAELSQKNRLISLARAGKLAPGQYSIFKTKTKTWFNLSLKLHPGEGTDKAKVHVWFIMHRFDQNRFIEGGG